MGRKNIYLELDIALQNKTSSKMADITYTKVRVFSMGLESKYCACNPPSADIILFSSLVFCCICLLIAIKQKTHNTDLKSHSNSVYSLCPPVII